MEHSEEEDRLTFCKNRGWDDYVYKMFVVDYLILNRDRHGANIEVLRNKKKRTIRLAPLFDHGLSLMFNSFKQDELETFDVMEDKKVNSYLGSFSARDNLDLIPKDKLPQFNKLKESDKKVLFEDLKEVIGIPLIDKIWEMIFCRWRYYEDFCDKRMR